MSSSGKKKNAVHPTSDNLLSVPNGAHAESAKKKASPKKKLERKTSKLWTEEIQALKSCEEFYIKQLNLHTEDTFNPSYFDIRNAKGRVTFKGIESIDPVIRDLYHNKGKPPYIITIFDLRAGKEMLRINANLKQGVMLVYVRQSTEDKIIGIVRQVHPKCPLLSSTFSLERPNGAVLMRIQSSFSLHDLLCCTCPKFMKIQNRGNRFRILMSDEVTHVGDIQYRRKRFDQKDDEESNRREEMICATFPGDTINTNKALILASLFMLDSIYFQKKRRVKTGPIISRTCYIIIIIVLTVILIGVLAAVFGGGGYQGSKVTGGGRRPGLG